MSEAQEAKIKKLEAENVRLNTVLSTAKIVKEFSDYFRNKDSDTHKIYKNLSETAKHIESKHSDILDKMYRDNAGKYITVSQFNDIVATALKQYLNL